MPAGMLECMRLYDWLILKAYQPVEACLHLYVHIYIFMGIPIVFPLYKRSRRIEVIF